MKEKTVLAALLAACASAGHADLPSSSDPLEPVPVRAEVTVKRLAITPSSKPLLASAIDLAAQGYIEEEFVVSGTARTYEWVDGTTRVRPVSEPGRYATRILIRRPIDPARFSGNIELEALNSSTGIDITTTMGTSADHVMKNGDVWIGFTSKPVALGALRRFDPQRYADLAWSNPTPAAARCEHPSIIPEYALAPLRLADLPPISSAASEDGLVWDIYAQLAALLKSNQRSEILPGFRQPHVFATGYSQSGMIQRTFATAFHKVMRAADGGPLFDGYLIEVGPAMLRINQCSADVLPDDPRNRLPAIDVPIINIVSEGDMWLGRATRQPDIVNGRSGLVTYEIAGASHKTGFGEAGHVSAEERARSGVPALPAPPGIVLNDFPRGFLSSAALANLHAWAREGRAPPQAAPLATKDGELARDRDGNALGGLRSPWIEVPLASYRGALGLGPLAVVGQKFPYSPERLQALYPTRQAYMERMRKVVAAAIEGRWLLRGDEPAILNEAGSAYDAARTMTSSSP